MTTKDCYCSVIGGRKFLCEGCARKLQRGCEELDRLRAFTEAAAIGLETAAHWGMEEFCFEPPEGCEVVTQGWCDTRALAKKLREELPE